MTEQIPYPKTKDEWFTNAAKVLPQLPKYAGHFMRVDWNQAEAERELAERDGQALATRLDRLWEQLPDSPSIRFQPFFDLCDLCSERHVLDEPE